MTIIYNNQNPDTIVSIVINGNKYFFQYENISLDEKVSFLIDKMYSDEKILKYYNILLLSYGKILKPNDKISLNTVKHDNEIVIRLIIKEKKPYARINVNNVYKYVKFNQNYTYTDLITQKKLPNLLDNIPSNEPFYTGFFRW
mgnify:CR=1 FL=1|tara:strand:+ start:478 stop:906 length:429 start_codon:yes stop_codon:yes gene_type:complete